MKQKTKQKDIVKTRKDHICDACGRTIKKGSKMHYWECKVPRFENDADDPRQIGIEYHKGWICSNDEECVKIMEGNFERDNEIYL